MAGRARRYLAFYAPVHLRGDRLRDLEVLVSGQRRLILVGLNFVCLPVNLYVAARGSSTELRVLGLFAAVACAITIWRFLRDPDSFS